MARRAFLSKVITLPFLGMTAWSQQATNRPLKIMMKSAWDLMIRQSRHSRSCMGLRFQKPGTPYRSFC